MLFPRAECTAEVQWASPYVAPHADVAIPMGEACVFLSRFFYRDGPFCVGVWGRTGRSEEGVGSSHRHRYTVALPRRCAYRYRLLSTVRREKR